MDSRPNYNSEFTEVEHYNRNEFNLEFSWEEFQKLQARLPDQCKWIDSVIVSEHQNHTVNGKDNRKYVSHDGYFELIYNDNNILQTEKNNPDDMGTFNYYSPTEEKLGHLEYDWYSYKWWGNVR